MKWYWIVLAFLGFAIYLIIGAVFANLLAEWWWQADDDDVKTVVVLLWPLAVPFLLLMWLIDEIAG